MHAVLVLSGGAISLQLVFITDSEWPAIFS